MPDERVRPTSNLNSGWGAGGDFSYVDDNVTQPSAGSGDTATFSGDDGGVSQQWGCAAPTNTGTISAATLWMRVRFDSNSDGYISLARVRLNGTWYNVTLSGTPGGGSWGWVSGTTTGSYGALSGSAPAIDVQYTGATIDGTIEVDVAYLDITYSSGPPERYAVATGNWSATGTWNGGTLPAVGDDVYANGFTVTVDSNRTANTVRTTAGTTAVAGGGFTLSNGVTLTLTGSGSNAIAGSSTCITYSGTSGNSATLVGNPLASATTGSRHGATNTNTGTLNITGNPTGGASASSFGAVNSSTGTLNIVGNPVAGVGSASSGARSGSGTMNITGNVTGGTSVGASAAYWAGGAGTVVGTVTGGGSSSLYGLQNAGAGTVAITGSVVGGSAANAMGALNSSSGTITVSGNATGGSNATAYGASNTGAGTLTVAGKATSAIAPAVNGGTSATLTSVGTAETGSDCIHPINGKVVFANLATATYGIRNSAGTLGTLTAGGSGVNSAFRQKVIA